MPQSHRIGESILGASVYGEYHIDELGSSERNDARDGFPTSAGFAFGFGLRGSRVYGLGICDGGYGPTRRRINTLIALEVCQTASISYGHQAQIVARNEQSETRVSQSYRSLLLAFERRPGDQSWNIFLRRSPCPPYISPCRSPPPDFSP